MNPCLLLLLGLLSGLPEPGNIGTNWRVIVDLPKQRLFALEGDRFVFEFRCSTGKPGRTTPQGEYRVREKLATNNALPKYGGGPIPWSLRLKTATGEPVSFLIHGYKDVPNYPASNSCIRLVIAEAKRLFYRTAVETPVTIGQLPVAPSPYKNPRLLITFDEPWIYALADKVNGEPKVVFQVKLRARPPYVGEGELAGFNHSPDDKTRCSPFGSYVLRLRQESDLWKDGQSAPQPFFVFLADGIAETASGSLQILASNQQIGNGSQFVVGYEDGIKLARFLRGGMKVWVHPVIPID